MIIEGNKIDFFADLFKEAKSAASETITAMERHYAQYRGDPTIDGTGMEAEHIRNITYELVESQVTGYIPTPKVKAKKWSERNERNAKSIETLLRNKRDELPFEYLNDMDERYNPIYGGSVWLVEWDDSIVTHDTVGDIKVSCISPLNFYGQPNIYDIREMEYCFVVFETTKEDIERKYGVSIEVAESTESEEGDDKTATLIVCYYKNEDDNVSQYIWSGDTELLDIDDYFSRKRKVCKACGKREQLCECEHPDFETESEDFEELDRDIHLSDGSTIPAMSPKIEDGMPVTKNEPRQALDANGNIMLDSAGGVLIPMMTTVAVPVTERTKLPFYRPSTLPVVIRKNTSQEECLFGQSDCEFIRPQQQAINIIESRIAEKIMQSASIALVPDGFTGTISNAIKLGIMRVKNGEQGLYGKVDLQSSIAQDIVEADRLYDHAKRILGITDSFQGQYDGSAQSGKAKQLQIQQAAGRLDSKRRMKNAAYADIDRIIFEYYLAYADEPRPASYKDAMGVMQNVEFNRYDFIQRDINGEYYYDDQFLFSADSGVDLEDSRESLWEQNRLNFQLGAYGNPQLPQTLLIYWLNMERAHYPHAADNVERIREEIARQAQMEQMQQQIAAQGEELAMRQGYEQYLTNTMTGGASNV